MFGYEILNEILVFCDMARIHCVISQLRNRTFDFAMLHFATKQGGNLGKIHWLVLATGRDFEFTLVTV